jgi:RNA polymerase sigma-70 factor, ECF subfamily
MNMNKDQTGDRLREVPASGPSDEDLMKRYQHGDAGAMNALIDRHDRQLFGFLYRSLGSRERAEDAYQEVFLKVVRSAEGYRPTARFAAWLYTIARHVVIDMARRDKYRETESLDQEVYEDGGVARVEMEPGHEPDPEAELTGYELQDSLERAISSLPAEQREVFLLRERSGLSFKEIAELTAAPLNTVKTRMHYALNRLRKVLADQGYMELKT